MTVLELTQPQAALQRANETRFQRAAVRRILRERADSRQEALDRLAATVELSGVAQCMKISDLLESCYGVGKTKSGIILRRINASDRRVLGDLSERQRELLLETLRNGL